MKGTEGRPREEQTQKFLRSLLAISPDGRRQSYYEIIMKSPVLILIIHNCHRRSAYRLWDKFEGGEKPVEQVDGMFIRCRYSL